MKIHLVLADDWELRGDGSGIMQTLQFDTMQKIIRIYEKYGLRGTFNVEVMQQLYHMKFGALYPSLGGFAREWKRVVKEAYSRGHDIQLHVHPQWHNAMYEKGKWFLGRRWSILDYSADDMRIILTTCKEYLEELIRPIDPDYRCVSFRSGIWCIAPNMYILPILSDLGIVFDMSIVDGLFYNFEMVRLDYREIDEPFLPYYPQMEDARRLATTKEKIVCIPTHSFKLGMGLRVLHKVGSELTRFLLPNIFLSNFSAPCAKEIKNSGVNGNYIGARISERNDRIGKKNYGQERLWGPSIHVLSDVSAISYLKAKFAIRDMRKKANNSGWSIVPVIIASHTKDIGDFKPIEKFCAYLSNARDIEVITAGELARNIRCGLYPIRRGNGGEDVLRQTINPNIA